MSGLHVPMHGRNHRPGGSDPIPSLGGLSAFQQAQYTASPSVPNNSLQAYNNTSDWTLAAGESLLDPSSATYVLYTGLYSVDFTATPAASVLAAGTLVRVGIQSTNSISNGSSISTITNDEVDNTYYAPGGVIGAQQSASFGPRWFQALVGDDIGPFVYQNSGGPLTFTLNFRLTFIATA